MSLNAQQTGEAADAATIGLLRNDSGAYLCDVVVVGGSAGGCAAALAASEAGASVCLLVEGDWPGGQLTSQGVCTPDEQTYIETFGGTRRYNAFRNAVRAHYKNAYQLSEAGKAQTYFNPGSCWVSKLSYEPRVGAQILRDMLARPERLTVLYQTRLTAYKMYSDAPDSIECVTVRRQDGTFLDIKAKYVLDATDMGDVLALCGREGEDWVIGAESRADTGEPDAPPEARPHWVQPFTFPFALEWSPDTRATNVIESPHDYEELKAQQDYKVLHGAITGLFAGRAPWWTYRRILARANFDDARIPSDIAMINTAGNDYYGGSILGPYAGTPKDVEATLAQARRASLGYVYWLQTECERETTTPSTPPLAAQHAKEGEQASPGAQGRETHKGYPEFRLRTDLFDTPDGCAPDPYIRESRRIKSLRPILEQEIVVKDFAGNVCRGERARAAFMPDSVGIGHYALDIHPNGHGEPNHYVATRPFQIPLSALIPVRLRNLLPACKNLGTTHLTNGAYRLHPIEWNIGESAGLLAAFCVRNNFPIRRVQEMEGIRRAFQRTLLMQGIALHWYVDVPLNHPAFMAVQQLASAGLPLGRDSELLFRPDEAVTAEDWLVWRLAVGGHAPETYTYGVPPDVFTGTRAEAARLIFDNAWSQTESGRRLSRSYNYGLHQSGKIQALNALHAAGLQQNAAQIPILLAVVQNPPDHRMLYTALHALAQMGDAEVVPAVEAGMRGLADVEAQGLAQAVRARLLAEAEANKADVPTQRAQNWINRFLHALALDLDAFNAIINRYSRPQSVTSMHPVTERETFALREMADRIYRQRDAVLLQAAQQAGIDFTADAGAKHKAQLALLSSQQRVEWIIDYLSKRDTGVFEDNYLIQLAADEGKTAGIAAAARLKEMDQRRDDYAHVYSDRRCFPGYTAMFHLLSAVGDEAQEPVIANYLNDPEGDIRYYANQVYPEVKAGLASKWAIPY